MPSVLSGCFSWELSIYRSPYRRGCGSVVLFLVRALVRIVPGHVMERRGIKPRIHTHADRQASHSAPVVRMAVVSAYSGADHSKRRRKEGREEIFEEAAYG